ncbi:MAG TPA: DUF2786 domain-containing protein [Acidimicrobiales bacterium]|nr:DUF2786 domain-containing protein [Acidimicrobiales bacterium]
MRQRARTRSSRRTGSVDATVEAAIAAAAVGDEVRARPLVERLARWPASEDPPGEGAADGSADPVARALAGALVAAMAAAWQNGWQPADVHRVVERRHGRAHARLAARAIGREARRHGEHELPSRWRLQLDAIGAAEVLRDGAGEDDAGWAVPWPPGLGRDGSPGMARVQAIEVAVATVGLVRSLPRLARLGPLPGEAEPAPGPRSRPGRRAGSGPGADPRVLHKVTSLLAKAESTNFPEEAEALTAKAQELMTRHAIDRAHVEARHGDVPQVAGRRIGVDDPYAGARYLLLSAVADANRCRAVWTRQWWFSTVFGDEGDLDAVELLYTSLLVQATRSMVAEPRPSAARSSSGSTRSFRQSFLVAFARRIGERLAEAADAVTAEEATRSTALVPLFAARREAADAALAAAFPDLRTTRMSARSAEGWHAGVRAADRAQLDVQRTVPRRAQRSLS